MGCNYGCYLLNLRQEIILALLGELSIGHEGQEKKKVEIREREKENVTAEEGQHEKI